jgi:hypothetical protein
MSYKAYLDQQLRSVILGHLLDFQVSYAKTKLLPTNDDINALKFKLLVLLEDCYLIISLYEKSKENKEEESEEQETSKGQKREELDRIREIEENVIRLNLIGDSLKDMEDIYDQVIEVFNKYLFPKEMEET